METFIHTFMSMSYFCRDMCQAANRKPGIHIA